MTILAGRHALLTGGGTGIGAAIARRLAADGARVTVVGRRRSPLESVAAEIGGAFAVADVTDADAVARALDAARAAHGPVSILVNNAGAAESGSFSRLDAAGWRRMMAVNLDALFAVTQACLADLKAAADGRIVTVASTAGLKGYAYAVAYSAAKHGAVGFTRALARELARTEVTVNAVCPGFTDTGLVDDAIAQIAATSGRSADQARAELVGFNPQGRLVSPEEVAAAVAWLCRPDSRSVTGRAIAIDGGECA